MAASSLFLVRSASGIAYVITLSVPNDDSDDRAVWFADEIRGSQSRLVTTMGVLLEIGNLLAKRRYRTAAVELLESLKSDLRLR